MEVSTGPLVSVIIPSYNAEKYIVDAVASALQQTHQPIEVMIVDDGSKDNTLEIINREYGGHKAVRILTHPDHKNLGVSKTRSLGIQESRGTFIAYLDADDMFTPTKIEKQLQRFKKDPSLVLVHSCVELKIESGEGGVAFDFEFRSYPQDCQYALLDSPYLERNTICNSTVLVKREVLKTDVNSFNQVFQYEDWINWILLADQGNFYYMNEPLTVYRYHAQASTYGLVNNQLKPVFAKLEMLFILMSRAKDASMKDRIYIEMDRQLKIGIRNYRESLPATSLMPFYFTMVLATLKRNIKKYLSKVKTSLTGKGR